MRIDIERQLDNGQRGNTYFGLMKVERHSG